ncbi:MAG: hypothetical protein GC192_11955 [Bacteroidetes bacterium]|nr:hypothetical protein [Bacteroidota bacterium]
MEKSNLVSICRALDKKEVRELRKWVNSPAHNQRQDVSDLFEYLATGQNLDSEKKLEKERVFKAIYPDKTYSDAEMRQVMHFLLRVIENFLVYNELAKDEVRSQTILAKVYRKRQLPKLFQKTMEVGQNIQQQQPFRNHQYFENEFFLQFEQYTYLSGLGRNAPLNLQEVSDANDVAFLANKLQLSCIMLSHQAVFKTTYKLQMLNELLTYLENNPLLLKVPAIAIYYYQYKAMTKPEAFEHFRMLKQEIFENGHLFPPEEMRVIYLLTINYCIGRINAGIDGFLKESFEFYKNGIQKNIFLENGVLSRFTFGNIVIAGLNLKEFDWVENFINEYKVYLDEKHREDLVHFNLARLNFERKNYKKAMQLFATLDYDDILMNLVAKTMLLKMYYELDEFSALDSLIGSMKTYLQRKKVMGYHKDNYKNIIQYTKKMLKMAHYDKEQIQKLKQEIEATNPLTERKWLLAQLDKL